MKIVLPQVICITLLISFLSVSAQYDTVRKYSNGSYLFKIPSGFELRDYKHQAISQWNEMAESFYLKSEKIQRVRKIEGEKKTEGLFNASKGILLLDLNYEIVSRFNLPEEYALVKKGSAYAIVSLITLKSTSFSYSSACSHLNTEWLMAFTENKTHIYNKQLQLIDSIPDVTGQNGLLSNNAEVFMIARTTQGVGILDKHNKLLIEKGWTRIRTMEGNRIAVSTKDGFGIYDIKKHTLIAPYQYDDYQAEYAGLHFLLLKRKQYKLIDSIGNTIFEISADGISPGYRWEAFFFAKDGLWGLINKRGEVIQSPIWNNFENTYLETFQASAPNKAAIAYTYKYKETNGVKTLVSLLSTPVTPAITPLDSSLPPIDNKPPPPKMTGEDEENKVYSKMEINPSFNKNGVNEQEYLLNAIKAYRKKNNFKIKGSVIVTLVIEKDGNVSETDILQSSNPRLKAPSLKIIKEMKPWKPGQQNGRIVRGRVLLTMEW